jgi:hypothetical protein
VQGNTSVSETYGFRPRQRPLTKDKVSTMKMSIFRGITSFF